MYNSWQSSDWSGNNGGGNWQKPSDPWQQPGGWCEPNPNYPPKYDDDRNDDGDLGAPRKIREYGGVKFKSFRYVACG